MMFYVHVDPKAIAMNREGLDEPTCVIGTENNNEVFRVHGVHFPGEAELKYFKDGERLGLGANVCIVAEGPIRYMTRLPDGHETWKEIGKDDGE